MMQHADELQPDQVVINQPCLLYCAAGAYELRFRQHSQTIKAGQICLLLPFDPASLSVPEICSLQKLELSEALLQAVCEGLPPRGLLSQFLLHAPERQETVFALYSPNPMGETETLLDDCMVHAAVGQEVLLPPLRILLRYLHERWGHTVWLSNAAAIPDYVPVLEFIQKNYHSVTLKSLSEEFHYAQSYVSTMISHTVGQKFTVVVRRLRMAEAEKYLIKTHWRLERIALKVGYQTENQFSRAFRQQYGMSPQAFRRHYQDEKAADDFSSAASEDITPDQFLLLSCPWDSA